MDLKSECASDQQQQNNFFEILNFPNRKIQKGSCLNHFENKDYLQFLGMDKTTGKPWLIIKINIFLKEEVIDDTIENIKNQIKILSQLKTKNLITYESVLCVKKRGEIILYLLQEFISGSSIGEIFDSYGLSVESISKIAKSILDVLMYLEEKNISIGLLNKSNIFLCDNQEVIRINNFDYLKNVTNFKENLTALGNLIEDFKLNNSDMTDFIHKCKSVKSASDLMNHPFLTFEQNKFINDHHRLETDFTYIDLIGQGAFGKVSKYQNILDRQIYAIKQICLPQDRELREKIIREAKLLSGLKHKNIVTYKSSWLQNVTDCNYDVEEDDDYDDDENESYNFENLIISSPTTGTNKYYKSEKYSENKINCEKTKKLERLNSVCSKHHIYIQMEFCKNLTLRDAINEGLSKDRLRVWKLFEQILEGLEYLHNRNIIHRDLKPENIFLDAQDNVKIGDFGVAIQKYSGRNKKHHSNTYYVGTLLYVAPELKGHASKSEYSNKVDMFSLGIIFFEMIQPKFNSTSERILILENLRKPTINLPENLLGCDQFVKIIKLLLNHNEEKRPNAKKFLTNIIKRSKLTPNEFKKSLEKGVKNITNNEFNDFISIHLTKTSHFKFNYQHSDKNINFYIQKEYQRFLQRSNGNDIPNYNYKINVRLVIYEDHLAVIPEKNLELLNSFDIDYLLKQKEYQEPLFIKLKQNYLKCFLKFLKTKHDYQIQQKKLVFQKEEREIQIKL